MQYSDSVKNDFLALIQDSFPLVQRPFYELGNIFGMSENEALGLYERLKSDKIIRQTSAILDTKKLGYHSSLVAFMVDENHIDDVATFISSHPGVSHNYKRSHDFNLWFTIAVPPDSALGLTGTVELLSKQDGVRDFMILPTLKMFKIAVKLDTNKSKATKEVVTHKEYSKLDLTPIHLGIIEQIQSDIAVEPTPFRGMMDSLNIDEIDFFRLMNELKNSGYMRRYATILNHRNAGFVANAMVVWNVQDEKANELGAKSAEFSAVSHCYLRPRARSWNYNLFTMIHASSDIELQSLIQKISVDLGVSDFAVLHSTHEYKKSRIKYFTKDYYEWEKR